MSVLVIDVGGTHVKVLLSGERKPRKFESGPKLTAREMVAGVKQITGDWKYAVKLVNDAAMQGLGSYKRGKMLFLGLGTGLDPDRGWHRPFKSLARTVPDFTSIQQRERRSHAFSIRRIPNGKILKTGSDVQY